VDKKQFEFTGTAGGYFIVAIVTGITVYIPIFGWPIGFNFMYGWLGDNVLINGRKVKYSAKYGETLKFLFVNLLLTIITFGIYSFWFAVKTYKFVASHTAFVDTPAQSAAVPEAPVAPTMPEAPAAPMTPSAPVPPAPIQ